MATPPPSPQPAQSRVPGSLSTQVPRNLRITLLSLLCISKSTTGSQKMARPSSTETTNSHLLVSFQSGGRGYGGTLADHFATGAAASLKYANPQDLPSFPSSGLKKNDAAAGAAASLGWANQKPFEHWKPDRSASASAAAMIAKDYKMKEAWQPEKSSHGAKAALLAHRDSGPVEIWRPETDSPWGHSAATQAFRKFSDGGLYPTADYGYTDDGRRRSLMAATGAMSEDRRKPDLHQPHLRIQRPTQTKRMPLPML